MYVSTCICLYVCVKKMSRTDSSELTVNICTSPGLGAMDLVSR